MKRLLSFLIITMLLLTLATGCGTQKPAEAAGKNQAAQSTGNAPEANVKLTMGLIPSEDITTMKKKYEPLKSYLEKETGYEIDMFVAADYAGAVEAMKAKKTDFSFYGALTYIIAEKEAGATPLVVEARPVTGVTYYSLIVVPKDSPIKSIEDLKGKTYGFVDPGSTSGYAVPFTMFKKNNIDVKTYFKETKFLGGHDAVATAVLNKQVEAGSMDDLSYNKLVDDKKMDKDDLRIIWKSSPLPGSLFAARGDMDSKVKAKLVEAFTNIHKKNPDALGGIGKIDHYEAVTADAYKDIREVATTVGVDLGKK